MLLSRGLLSGSSNLVIAATSIVVVLDVQDKGGVWLFK
jgi:hypothetical protein